MDDPISEGLTMLGVAPSTVLTVLACLRGLLFVLDRADKRFPRLLPVANALGKLLGGAKARG